MLPLVHLFLGAARKAVVVVRQKVQARQEQFLRQLIQTWQLQLLSLKKKRTEQRAETESRDPTTKIVANILSSENKREPKLEEYFKRLA